MEEMLQALFDNIITSSMELCISMNWRESVQPRRLQLLSQAIDKKRHSPLEVGHYCPQGQCRCGRR